MDTVKLRNGVEMPILGYGVYQVSPSECERCVRDAISAGYRLIDTAQAYGNEQNVGNAIRNCGVPRDAQGCPEGRRLLRCGGGCHWCRPVHRGRSTRLPGGSAREAQLK